MGTAGSGLFIAAQRTREPNRRLFKYTIREIKTNKEALGEGGEQAKVAGSEKTRLMSS